MKKPLSEKKKRQTINKIKYLSISEPMNTGLIFFLNDKLKAG